MQPETWESISGVIPESVQNERGPRQSTIRKQMPFVIKIASFRIFSFKMLSVSSTRLNLVKTDDFEGF